MSSPDPIKEAYEYQQMLLAAAAAAGDDPADVQEATVGRLRELVLGPEIEAAARRSDGEWTALGVALHLADAELVMAARYRWALTQDTPPVYGYDQDLWVDGLVSLESSRAELVELFAVLRNANVRLWRAASEEQRQRTVMHSERGPESFDMMFRMIAGHDQVHLAQVRDTPKATA